MRDLQFVTVVAGLTAALLMPSGGTAGQSFALDSIQGLQPHDVTVEGNVKGAVALWIGLGTEAHFANLRLSD